MGEEVDAFNHHVRVPGALQFCLAHLPHAAGAVSQPGGGLRNRFALREQPKPGKRKEALILTCIAAKAGAMNSLNDTARQAARSWSEQLGSLAAASPVSRPDTSTAQLDNVPPADLSSRLSAILSHFRQRRARQEHAAEELRAREFLTGK
jgi:hypothetical protein